MLIAARDSFRTTGNAAPYDAEISYIGGDSVSAWIDTNFLTSTSTDIEVTMSFTPSSSVKFGGQTTKSIRVGSRVRQVATILSLTVSNDTYTKIDVTAGVDVSGNTTPAKTLTWTASEVWDITTPHTILIKPSENSQTCLYVDGTQVAAAQTATHFPEVILPFGQYGTTSTSGDVKYISAVGNTVSTPCRIYAAKLWNNGALAMDFKAVRKGNVGYLFDAVSNQLFDTAGAGAFTLGPDK